MSKLTAVNEAILKQLPEPKNVFQHFLRLNQTPRGSGKLDQFRQYLKDEVARIGNGVQVHQDKIGNILIRKPATKENAPSVAIQCHMDMVWSQNEGTGFDFDTQGINMEIRNKDYLHAQGTTLGADNGIGVAAGLALVEENLANVGQLEILITADEETTMGGAEFMDKTLMESNILINVDSEEEFAICVGCAGGFETKLNLPITRENGFDQLDQAAVKVKVQGLTGGHTGIDIHRGRGNAFKLAARILGTIPTRMNLVSFTGGSAVNTIPRECSVVVSVAKDAVESFKAAVNKNAAAVLSDFKAVDPNFNVEISQVSFGENEKPLDLVSTRKVFDFVHILPNGVLRNEPSLEGAVETSTSYSLTEIEADSFMAHLFTRSSNQAQMDITQERLLSIGRLTGAKVSDKFNGFPSWRPNMESKALKVVKECTVKVLGKEPHVYAVHAGLECGLLIGNYPNLDCVSIGPLIEGAHTPEERMFIPSVDRFYRLLKETLLEMSK